MRQFLENGFILLAVSLCSIAFTHPAHATDHINAIIRDLPVNTWHTVPSSALVNDPAAAQNSEFPGIGVGNFNNARGIFVWGGGALDTKRDRLLLWGGGHGDYYGNEVYAFNLEDFTWDRITDPSPPLNPGSETNPTPCAPILADGNPNSRHTYYNLDYIPETDSLFASPGFALACRNAGPDRNTWRFDLAANEADRNTGWSIDNPAVAEGHPQRNQTPNAVGGPSASARDPNSDLVYTVSTGGLFAYSTNSQLWTRLGTENILSPDRVSNGPSRGAVVHPTRNQLVVVGHEEVVVYDLDNRRGRQYQKQVWETGANNAGFQDSSEPGNRNLYRPGVNYDPVLDRIVVWDGGAVQALDLETREWEALGGLAPQIPHTNGTYGRFRYSPTQNAYVLVNDGNQDVLIFKASNIPEPTGVALLLTAIPFMATLRRRRRN